MKQTKTLIIMALLLLCGAATASSSCSAAPRAIPHEAVTQPAMAAENSTTTPRKKTKKMAYEEETRRYEIPPFDRIECTTIANIYLMQGNETSVEARLHTGSLDLLDVSVENGCLIITNIDSKRYNNHYSVGPDDKIYFGDLDGKHSLQQEVDFYITTPTVSHIALDGASHLTAKELNVPKLAIKVSAISAITLENLVCNDTRMNLAGAFACDINATGDRLTLDGSGVGKTKLKFKGGKLVLNNSGACAVKAEVDCEELQVENTGVGKITLKGTADRTNIESNGASSIDTKQLNQY